MRGQFTEFTGALTVDEDPALSSAEAAIRTARITTHVDQRDIHLRSADFRDADRYPTMTFRSTENTGAPATGFTVLGELSIKGCTRPVRGGRRVERGRHRPLGAATDRSQRNRKDRRRGLGITFNAPLEGGGFLIGKTVEIEIEIEAIRESS